MYKVVARIHGAWQGNQSIYPACGAASEIWYVVRFVTLLIAVLRLVKVTSFGFPQMRWVHAFICSCLVWAIGTHCRVSSQLHFARPTVYNEIYNPQNKWDKDYEYYRA